MTCDEGYVSIAILIDDDNQGVKVLIPSGLIGGTKYEWTTLLKC